MAIDTKYGQVSLEWGTIGENEPVVVFRAQDELLLEVLDHYLWLCFRQGSPDRHLQAIRKAKAQVRMWQDENPTKTPTSDKLIQKGESS